MSDTTTYELIESYLNGTLPVSEHAAFEKQMEDIDFKRKVEQHRFANLLIKKNGLLAIKELVAKEDQLAEKKATIKKAILSASVVLLASIAVFWFTPPSPPEKQALSPVPKKAETIQSKTASPNEMEHAIAEKKAEAKSPVLSTKKETATKPVIEKNPETPLILPEVREMPSTVAPSAIPEQEQIQEKKEWSAQASASTNRLCEKVELVAHVQASPSCQDGHTGSIHVTGFKGGSSPYSFTVIEEGQTVSSPLHLAAGKYAVSIKDAYGCIKTLENIWVKEQDCKTEFSFNPFNGEVWEIPVYASKGTLTIYDELGNVYFRSEIGAETKTTWSGYSVKGELKTGYFPFVIKYQDGYTKEGSVSIGK